MVKQSIFFKIIIYIIIYPNFPILIMHQAETVLIWKTN